MQGRHFNFFLGGQNFFIFFNATGLLKNWKQHFICSNFTLFIVPFFLSFFLFFFYFFFFFFLFSFSLGGRRPPSPPQITPLHIWRCFGAHLQIWYIEYITNLVPIYLTNSAIWYIRIHYIWHIWYNDKFVWQHLYKGLAIAHTGRVGRNLLLGSTFILEVGIQSGNN